MTSPERVSGGAAVTLDASNSSWPSLFVGQQSATASLSSEISPSRVAFCVQGPTIPPSGEATLALDSMFLQSLRRRMVTHLRIDDTTRKKAWSRFGRRRDGRADGVRVGVSGHSCFSKLSVGRLQLAFASTTRPRNARSGTRRSWRADGVRAWVSGYQSTTSALSAPLGASARIKSRPLTPPPAFPHQLPTPPPHPNNAFPAPTSPRPPLLHSSN